MVAQLPPEIIQRCLIELAALPPPPEVEQKARWLSSKTCRSSSPRRDLVPYFYVCRMFKDSLLPLVYRTVKLYMNTDGSDKLVQRLLATPDALPHIRCLQLDFSRSCCPSRFLALRPKGRCARLMQLFKSMPNLADLDIRFSDDQRHHVVQCELILGRLVSDAAGFHLERFSFNAVNEICYKMRVRVIEDLLLAHRQSLKELKLQGPWARELVFSARVLSKLSALQQLFLGDVSVKYWPQAKDEWEARAKAKHYLKFNSREYGQDLLSDFEPNEEEEAKAEIERTYRLQKPRQPSTPFVELALCPQIATCEFLGHFDDLFSNVLPIARTTQKLTISLEKDDAIVPPRELPQLPDLSALEIRYLDHDVHANDPYVGAKIEVGRNLETLLELFGNTSLRSLTVAVCRAHYFVAVVRMIIDLLRRPTRAFPKAQSIVFKLDCSELAFVREQHRALVAAKEQLDLVRAELAQRGISQLDVIATSTCLSR